MQRYYYDEDGNRHEIEIPDSLRLKNYVAVRGSVTSVTSVTNFEGFNGTVTDVTVTPHTNPQKIRKNVCDLCGAEAITTEYDGGLVCEECLQRLGNEDPDFFDDDFEKRS